MRAKYRFLAVLAAGLITFSGCNVYADTDTNTANKASDETVDLEDIPEYSGESFVVLNNDEPFFEEEDLTDESYEEYAKLDELGRCGVACASIGQDLMPTEERGEIGKVKPSGWQLAKYNDVIDGNYLYNRCHLIGFQLTGENANVQNLITGTRWLNVEGMLPFENAVADFVESTDLHVLYRVTPLFEDDNLVASGVEIEAESVEDEGASICFNVYIYNIQPGIEIDYSNGDSKEDKNAASEVKEAKETQEKIEETLDDVIYGDDYDASAIEAAKETAETTKSDQSGSEENAAESEAAEPAADSAQASEKTFILNTNTKKFHYPDCRSVKQMKDANKQEFTGTRDELIAQGYEPCGNCNP